MYPLPAPNCQESQKTLAKLTGSCFNACVTSMGNNLASNQQVIITVMIVAILIITT